LTELDKAKEGLRDQLVYVGLSRARNHAIVIGEFPAINPAPELFNIPDPV
jgi:ATP-dependent exoDNAse (exonuclease V) alpha subunit